MASGYPGDLMIDPAHTSTLDDAVHALSDVFIDMKLYLSRVSVTHWEQHETGDPHDEGRNRQNQQSKNSGPTTTTAATPAATTTAPPTAATTTAPAPTATSPTTTAAAATVVPMMPVTVTMPMPATTARIEPRP